MFFFIYNIMTDMNIIKNKNKIKIKNSETVGVHSEYNVNQVNTNLNALNWMIKLTQKFN